MNIKEFWNRSVNKTAVLSPIDRTSEVLFGLIMVLTFTGAISVSSDGKEEIRSLLWAALGCNVAWGLVDAIMYLMNVVFERGNARNMLNRIRKSKPGTESGLILKEELPPAVAELMSPSEIARLEDKIRQLPDAPLGSLLTFKDFISAVKIFLLVFFCTLPVALPFRFFEDPYLALKISNGIALLLLFIGGFNLAHHAGFKPFITALIYMLIGVVLVAITMALGG